MTLLDAIRQARQESRLLEGGKDWGVTLEEAYRIQETLFPGPLKGFKLGLVSKVKQQQMLTFEPIFGRVHPEMFLEEVLLSRFLQPRVEPEVAAVLKEDLPPGSPPGKVCQAIGRFFIAVDVLDSVWAGYRFTLPEVVADNASGGGFIVGLRAYGRLPRGNLRLYLNGEKLTEGPVEALGDPGERLSWLAERVGGLKSGQVVFLGSPAPAVPLDKGVLELCAEGSVLLRRIG